MNDPKNDKLLLYGSYNRINSLKLFGYYLNFNVVDTICILFKLRWEEKNIDAIYSYSFIEETKKTKDGFVKKGEKNNIAYKYFTLGGSFISKDGEFRSTIIPFQNIRTIKQLPMFKNILHDLLKYISREYLDREIYIKKEFFYPNDSKRNFTVQIEYHTWEIQLGLLSFVFFNTFYNLKNGIVENHLNEKFKEIIFSNKKKDLEFFNNLIKTYSLKTIKELRFMLNHVFLDDDINKLSNVEMFPKLGQKIIPLSIAESQNPFNIRFKPWREYLINNFLSNLVVNNVSPGFFLSNSWFYIKNARKGLFDNEIQYDKMQRSELAIQITDLLSKAQLFTHENINELDIKKIKKQNISFISHKFKELANQIQEPIDYAKEDIIMSNVALCMISEYVGRTLWDVLLISKSSSEYYKDIGMPFSSCGFSIFSKYMFEICYNLYCMNSIAGILHGDLHLNNLTLNNIIYKNIKNISSIKNPSILYVLGDENIQYIFPTVGCNICIIDFSRSIILPDKIDHFKDDSIPSTYKHIDEMNTFQKNQIERLVNIYVTYTEATNKDELFIIFKNKFEAVFKLMTSTDLYGVTDKILYSFGNCKNIIKPDKKCIDFLKELKFHARFYFTEEMNKLLNESEYEKIVLEMEWPIFSIIKRCFYKYNIMNCTNYSITDIYNIDNPINFSVNKFKNFPPIIKEIVDELKHKSMDSNWKNRKKIRNNFEKTKDECMKVVSYIAQRQKEKTHI